MSADTVVLLVDDEPFVLESLVEIVDGLDGLTALSTGDVGEARRLLREGSVDVVVSDLQMPGGGAMRLLEDAAPDGPPVIVITGVGTVARAVDAMKAGAFDFVQKPVDPEELLMLVRRACEHRRLLHDVRFLRATVERGADTLVGESPGIREVRRLVAQVAPAESTVLVTGESGTGKELVAAEIHRASPRAGRNLVVVNCGAVPENLFESEFFGHRRGAFSGAVSDRDGHLAEAEGGTLVLDEVSTLKPEMQAKLLRVLESGEYQVVGESRTRQADARVVAVSNEPLQALVDEGEFRADLYYRLAVFPIDVPPLRERPEDVAPISRHLLERLRGAPDGPPPLSPEALAILGVHHWTGNVRELRNVLERAVILCDNRVPDAETIASILEASVRHSPPSGENALHLRSRLDATEKELLREALERSAGRRKDAAAMLGIDPRNLSYYLRKHDLQSHGDRTGG